VLEDEAMVTALTRLIDTMISRQELEAFVRAMMFLQRPSTDRFESDSGRANGNGMTEIPNPDK